MASRYGFGSVTGTADKSGKEQFEHGHVDVSSAAITHAVQEYPEMPPKQALGALLAGVEPEALEGGSRVQVEWEALHDSLTEIDGVGEETAEAIMATVQEAVLAKGE